MAEEEIEIIDVEQLEQDKARHYFTFIADMYPDIDVGFLQSKCIEYAFDQAEFNNFIIETMMTNSYPKEKPSLKDVYQINNNWKKFEVTAYLAKFPDPDEHFSRSANGSKYVTFSTSFLLNRFKYVSASMIKRFLKKHDFNLFLTYKELIVTPKSRKTPRRANEIGQVIGTPPVEYFDEITYIKREADIIKYQCKMRLAREKKIAKARKAGTLVTCGCCFSDEFLPGDVISCPEDHPFCKDCVKKSTEVQMGDGKLDFPCLTDCGAFFTVATLENAMTKVSHEKLLRKLQEREITQANIPGLESCAFCEFSAIPDENSRTFDCLVCKKSSCRKCRKESHLPYSCAEMADTVTRTRTYVEEKMTEALIRNCYNCGSKFIREDGCNKMTCHCGAKMCYVCRKPVKGYGHFNDNHIKKDDGKCPLWSNNNRLHKMEVNREAARAIEEIKRKNPDIDLKAIKKLRK